jgi:hypothetical protein
MRDRESMDAESSTVLYLRSLTGTYNVTCLPIWYKFESSHVMPHSSIGTWS